MGHRTDIIRETQLVYASLFADVTPKDLTDLVQEIRSASSFEAGFSELVDLSRVRSFNVAPAVLAEVGRACCQLFESDSKRVLFAPSDLAFGMSRMFQTYTEQAGARNVSVVRTRAEACSFLDIEERRIPQLADV